MARAISTPVVALVLQDPLGPTDAVMVSFQLIDPIEYGVRRDRPARAGGGF
jgi:hypothetical protein